MDTNGHELKSKTGWSERLEWNGHHTGGILIMARCLCRDGRRAFSVIRADKCALVVSNSVSTLSVFSPAKINLFLAITGRRADGFHELVSVVAQVDLGDTLTLRVESRAESRESRGADTEKPFTLECDDPAVPVDGTNLVLRAAEAFAAATGWRGRVHFRLEKRIPMGAGLGGGSSNAVAALRAFDQLAGGLLDAAQLAELAASLGSDCPLFLHDGPVVMRGRGELIEPLPMDAHSTSSGQAAARLRGRRVLIFKPPFGIATAWAYARLAARAPGAYLPADEAEARVVALTKAAECGAVLDGHLFNNMESVAFEKYLALPVLRDALRERLGLTTRMSGSGSACFALLPDGAAGSTGSPPAGDRLVARATALVREHWGAAAFVTEAKIL
jgi:4-diphosphocytidyl-2-C-methyl-D-erythritol kinase